MCTKICSFPPCYHFHFLVGGETAEATNKNDKKINEYSLEAALLNDKAKFWLLAKTSTPHTWTPTFIHSLQKILKSNILPAARWLGL